MHDALCRERTWVRFQAFAQSGAFPTCLGVLHLFRAPGRCPNSASATRIARPCPVCGSMAAPRRLWRAATVDVPIAPALFKRTASSSPGSHREVVGVKRRSRPRPLHHRTGTRIQTSAIRPMPHGRRHQRTDEGGRYSLPSSPVARCLGSCLHSTQRTLASEALHFLLAGTQHHVASLHFEGLKHLLGQRRSDGDEDL